MIYKGKLNISRFQFNEEASNTQKIEELAKLINCFVSVSQNLDFATDKNLFFVKKDSNIVAYNGGTPSVEINGYDVQEKLGLETPNVEINRLRKKIQQQLAPQNKGKVNTEKQVTNKFTTLKSVKSNDGK